MSYKIRVWYRDDADELQSCIITNAQLYVSPRPYLQYDDPMWEPVEVRSIAKRGLVLNHEDEHGNILRTGNYIPPHRITSIDWMDDWTEGAPPNDNPWVAKKS